MDPVTEPVSDTPQLHVSRAGLRAYVFELAKTRRPGQKAKWVAILPKSIPVNRVVSTKQQLFTPSSFQYSIGEIMLKNLTFFRFNKRRA
jgi:hypothetical protein